MNKNTYTNYPIYLNNNLIPAASVNFSSSMDYLKITSLGYSDTSIVQSSRQNGSIDLEFYLTSGMVNFLYSITGIIPIQVKIGNINFISGFLNSYNINIEPLSLIKTSLNIGFYTDINMSGAFNAINQSSISTSDFSHGAFSEIQPYLMNGDFLNAELSVSQNISPIFEIGSNNILGIDYQGGQIDCTLNGTGIQNNLTIFPNSGVNLLLNLKNMCNSSLGTLVYTGLRIKDYNFSINSEDIVGSVNLQGYF